MRHIPKAYERYRHFKGNCYQILAIAKSSEDESEQVVYQALYPPFGIYVRPLSMFMSEVDHEKYPSAAQRYRFELILEESDSKEETFDSLSADSPKGSTAPAGAETGTAEVRIPAAAETEPAAQAPQSVETQTPAGQAQMAGEEPDMEGLIDEDVLAFLDADTYEQKMNIFSAIHDKVTQEMLNTIAVSLDIEVDSEDLEERYRQIQNCLQTFRRYECNRLR